MQRTRYSCPILMKIDFFNRFLKTTQIPSFIKILQLETNYCVGTDRRTGRHDEANFHFSQFYEIA